MAETRTPTASVKKQVVETPTFGDVVVRKLMASERLELFDIERRDGEAESAFRRRAAREFTPRLLHLAARTVGDDAMYSQAEWDIQLAEYDDELGPVVRKALELNGFPVTTAGDDGKPVTEDAAKNG